MIDEYRKAVCKKEIVQEILKELNKYADDWKESAVNIAEKYSGENANYMLWQRVSEIEALEEVIEVVKKIG